jgi:hypothetical protein
MKRKFATPVRSIGFLPPGVAIAAALFLAALAVLSPQGVGKAEAYTITDDGSILVNASQVAVSLVWYEAELDNVFGMDSPVSQDFFSCRSQEAGVPVDAGIFGAGELIFRIKTPDGNTWLTGPASRNADNIQHAQLEPISDTVIRIHWEDQYGGGDQDFNDCNVEVTIQEFPTPTPTPTTTPTASGPCGDVNSSGGTTMVDAMLIAQCVAGLTDCVSLDPWAADVNCSLGESMVDAMLIAQKVAGLVPALGCCG